MDLGNLDLTLKISPKAQACIDRLLIRNPSATTSIGKIQLHNIVAPYEFLNLTLAQIGIETISVPKIAVS